LVEELIAAPSDLRLLTAADGKLGIALAREFQPEVILMDINLPGISGIEAMHILRADPATAYIRSCDQCKRNTRDIKKGLEAGFSLSHQPSSSRVHGHLEPGAGILRRHRRGTRGIKKELVNDYRSRNPEREHIDRRRSASNSCCSRKFCGRTGYTRVSSTMDPHAVTALHRQNRYDLILLDLQMPGMDGFQVMESLKAIETEGYIPGPGDHRPAGAQLQALQAGAKDFVSEPRSI